MAFDLQQEYSNQDPAAAGQSQEQPAAQDLTIPADAAAQLAQFISAGDCQSVCKLISGIVGGSAPAQ